MASSFLRWRTRNAGLDTGLIGSRVDEDHAFLLLQFRNIRSQFQQATMIYSSKRILHERAVTLGLNDDGGCSPWLVITLLSGISWWIYRELGSLAGVIGMLAAVGIACTMNGCRWMRRLPEGREGESICQFARSFQHRSADPLIIRAVFERLGVWIGCRGFPVRQDDDVFKDYRMDGMDFDDLVDEVAELTGRPLANMESNPYYGRVCTAGDLVRFFMNQPLSSICIRKS
jgi:hypothetical protein